MSHWSKTVLQYLLPHHTLLRVVQWSTRCRRFPLRKSITRWFIRYYNVGMSEALEPGSNAYPDFNSFFARALRPEVRPVVQEAGQICCTADSTINQLGDIRSGHLRCFISIGSCGAASNLTMLLSSHTQHILPFSCWNFSLQHLDIPYPLQGLALFDLYDFSHRIISFDHKKRGYTRNPNAVFRVETKMIQKEYSDKNINYLKVVI